MKNKNTGMISQETPAASMINETDAIKELDAIKDLLSEAMRHQKPAVLTAREARILMSKLVGLY